MCCTRYKTANSFSLVMFACAWTPLTLHAIFAHYQNPVLGNYWYLSHQLVMHTIFIIKKYTRSGVQVTKIIHNSKWILKKCHYEGGIKMRTNFVVQFCAPSRLESLQVSVSHNSNANDVYILLLWQFYFYFIWTNSISFLTTIVLLIYFNLLIYKTADIGVTIYYLRYTIHIHI